MSTHSNCPRCGAVLSTGHIVDGFDCHMQGKPFLIPAGEPTQAGEQVAREVEQIAESLRVEGGFRESAVMAAQALHNAGVRPASPAEEVERNIRHLAWDVEALEKLLTEEQRDSDEWFNLKANVAVLRAPSSAPRGPSAEAVEQVTRERAADRQLAEGLIEQERAFKHAAEQRAEAAEARLRELETGKDAPR